jgi:Polyketide cyclase / dehydrase and lipid transport
MAKYRYEDNWIFNAPLETVWNEIADPADWPSWWPSMQRVEQVAPGDALGVGAVHRYTVKGALPYRVSFDMRTTVIDTFRRIEGEATGDVQGRGIWTFGDDDGAVRVRYDWIVDTTKRWMVTLAPVAAPLFGWNHHAVMRRGQRGLAQRLSVR